MKYSTLVKWKTIRTTQVPRVADRIAQVKSLQLPNTAQITDFGLIQTGPKTLLRIEWTRCNGVPLHVMAGYLNKEEAGLISTLMIHTLWHWKRAGFVHGDLTPRNILVEVEINRFELPRFTLSFIDWALDLNDYSGTPEFFDPQIFTYGKTFASDFYALEKIHEFLKKHRNLAEPSMQNLAV